jgi:hypothetical protein
VHSYIFFDAAGTVLASSFQVGRAPRGSSCCALLERSALVAHDRTAGPALSVPPTASRGQANLDELKPLAKVVEDRTGAICGGMVVNGRRYEVRRRCLAALGITQVSWRLLHTIGCGVRNATCRPQSPTGPTWCPPTWVLSWPLRCTATTRRSFMAAPWATLNPTRARARRCARSRRAPSRASPASAGYPTSESARWGAHGPPWPGNAAPGLGRCAIMAHVVELLRRWHWHGVACVAKCNDALEDVDAPLPFPHSPVQDAQPVGAHGADAGCILPAAPPGSD